MYARILFFCVLVSLSLHLPAYGLSLQPRIDPSQSGPASLTQQNSSLTNPDNTNVRGSPLPNECLNSDQLSKAFDEWVWRWNQGRFAAEFRKPFGREGKSMPQAAVLAAVEGASRFLSRQQSAQPRAINVPGGRWLYVQGEVRISVDRTVSKEVTFEEVGFVLHAVRAFAQSHTPVPRAHVYVADGNRITAYLSLSAMEHQRAIS